MNRIAAKLCFVYLTLLLLWSCAPEKRDIRYGQDLCAWCSMAVADQSFGSELVTRRGKVHIFDSIECMQGYLIKRVSSPEEIHSFWITALNKPGALIDATTAFYLYSKQIPSPMGMHLSGYESEAAALQVQQQYGGTLLRWQELTVLVAAHWSLLDTPQSQPVGGQP